MTLSHKSWFRSLSTYHGENEEMPFSKLHGKLMKESSDETVGGLSLSKLMQQAKGSENITECDIRCWFTSNDEQQFSIKELADATLQGQKVEEETDDENDC